MFAPLFHIATFDERTNAGTRVFFNTGFDVRGMATTASGDLLAVVPGSTSDVLMRIDTTTGAFTTIGSLGFTGVQALTRHGATLLAWNATNGLINVNPTNGAASDLHPFMGSGGVDVQFLTTMSDGRVLAGRNELYEVNTVNGSLTLIGSSPGWTDLRGCEERFGSTTPFGTGCAGTNGTPAISHTFLPYPGTGYQLLSTFHLHNSFGILCFGASRTSSGGASLPLNVDPIFGTSGCRLLVSPDVMLGGTVDNSGIFVTPIPIPPGFGGQFFYAQHVVFELVPGNLSFSSGAEIRIGF
ncbi:MAG TPA: hypothetical protein VFZ65_05335 [Planctomycetota bacterium]|nr:hypothetical protein [Planctomycetota bacterium]